MTHLSSGGNITSLLCVKDCTVSNQLAVKELSVWAGENRIVTLPEHEVDLKASVVPAPPAGESLPPLGDSGAQAASARLRGLLTAAWREVATEGRRVRTRLWCF